MTDFNFERLFQFNQDQTEYVEWAESSKWKDHIKKFEVEGLEFLKVPSDLVAELTRDCFFEIGHFLRTAHLSKVSKILDDEEASNNDKFVANALLENAIIAAEGVFPSCQDTGTAIVMGKKGDRVIVEGKEDDEAISQGVYDSYQKNNFRYSQVAPLTMYKEQNTKTNLPAQIDLYAQKGSEYQFLFIAKGGGSANKTYLYQQTKALLNPQSLLKFVDEKIKTLGTAACPPYHLAFVVGGTSAEANLKTVKLASTGYLDNLVTSGSEGGRAFRDLELEEEIFKLTQRTGIGAQFGGKYFCHDVKVIRLPRHGASCPVGIGVSCSADRQIKAKISSEGVFIEKLEKNPAQFLKPVNVGKKEEVLNINLARPMKDILAELNEYPIKTRLILNGKIVVARDMAHAKIKERIDAGEEMPDYFKEHIIYYAGPAKTPDGFASGSFGPTTAQRMDSYVPEFQKLGGSMIMLAKGNRGKIVTDSCRDHGGFYLGSIGGPAAQLGKNCITNIDVLEYKELGMEAIFQITVKDFPAFIIVDNKGNDFFQSLS